MKEFINHCFNDADYKKEILRKIFHISTILVFPILYIFLTKKQMLFFVIPICLLIIATDFYRHKIPVIENIFHKIFGHILREKELEQNSRTSAFYMAVSALVVFIICPKIIAICAFSILAVSDCLASLVGKKMTSKEFFEKSVAGSVSFGISAFIILIICGILTHQHFGFYLFGSFAVTATTIIEARPSFFETDDNLTIPLIFSGVMLFFGYMWNLNY